MDCCQMRGIEDLFNDRLVNQELAQYRTRGPRQTTRILIQALKAKGVKGTSLLDIGGGVGVVQFELLEAGCGTAINVEASSAYIRGAREEAQRRGLAERVSYRHGNFIDLAGQVPEADIVTLDRVICCYPDVEKLVGLSAARARKLYGLVFPRDTRLVRVGFAVINFFYRLQRTPFRIFSHSTQAVEDLITSRGLKRAFYRRTMIWQVIVYTR
jgi:magnesium-protoporphyrin O-methyltransferase